MRKTFSEITIQLNLGFKVIKLIFRSSPKWASFYFLTAAVNSIIPAVTLYLGKLIIDAILIAIRNPLPNNIWPIIFLTLLAFSAEVGNSLFSSLSMYGYDYMKDIFNKFASEKILEKSASLDLAYFDSSKFHDQLEKVQRETYRFPNAMAEIVDLASSIIGLISLLFILLKLAFWAPVLLIIFSLPRLVFRLRYSYYTYSITDNRSPYNRSIWNINWLLTHKDAAKEIRAFNLKNFLIDKFKQINDRFIKENRQLAKRQNLFSFLLDLFGSTTYYFLGLFAAWRTIFGQITLGDLTMFTGTIRQFQNVLQGIFAYTARFYENNLFLSRYFEFMELKPSILQANNPKKNNNAGVLTVEFCNVSFGYEPKKLILEDINLKISDARNFALVGENGAGKTTLIKLLLRFYDPTSGQILINGTDIKEIDIDNLRENIGVIFQDYVRYDATARENIGFGDIRSINNIGKIRKSARLSGAAEFIEAFPEKYKTMLGKYFEEGEELSGGQWQKIALARAFFKDAPILILDEPTASLDPKSEYEVFSNLIKHTKDKSLILISHRFSTVRIADEIVVLHKGKIVEQGTHEQLIEKNGHYAKLYNLQARWYK